MSKITSKTIRPVKSGVGWPVNDTLRATEIASIDEQLSDFAIDTSPSGDTITGTESVQQDPSHPATHPQITGSVQITAPGATLGTGPGGGTLVCTGNINGTFPAYSPPTRTRRVRYSTLEVTKSWPNISSPNTLLNGCAPYVYQAGITEFPLETPGYTSPDVLMTFPLVKPHIGATITSITLYYFTLESPGSFLFASSGHVFLEKVSDLGVWTPIGTAATFPPGARTSNTPYAATVSGLSETVALNSGVYRIVVQEPNSDGQTAFIYTAIEINYTNIADERFSQ